MPVHVILGSKLKDIGLMIDFYKGRSIVRVNHTSFVDGIALETIPDGPSGHGRGMALINRKWIKIYFLKERENWSEDQYFALAAQLMKDKGIGKP